jgi:hypothetical protein
MQGLFSQMFVAVIYPPARRIFSGGNVFPAFSASHAQRKAVIVGYGNEKLC